jgi:hypothetical protein
MRRCHEGKEAPTDDALRFSSQVLQKKLAFGLSAATEPDNEALKPANHEMISISSELPHDLSRP